MKNQTKTKEIFIAFFALVIFASCQKKQTYNCAYYYERNGTWTHTGTQTKQLTKEELNAVYAANNKSNTKVVCAKK
jgi:hypothetical protein